MGNEIGELLTRYKARELRESQSRAEYEQWKRTRPALQLGNRELPRDCPPLIKRSLDGLVDDHGCDRALILQATWLLAQPVDELKKLATAPRIINDARKRRRAKKLLMDTRYLVLQLQRVPLIDYLFQSVDYYRFWQLPEVLEQYARLLDTVATKAKAIKMREVALVTLSDHIHSRTNGQRYWGLIAELIGQFGGDVDESALKVAYARARKR